MDGADLRVYESDMHTSTRDERESESEHHAARSFTIFPLLSVLPWM